VTDKYSKHKNAGFFFTDDEDADGDLVALPRSSKIKKKAQGGAGYEDIERKAAEQSKYQARAIKMRSKDMP